MMHVKKKKIRIMKKDNTFYISLEETTIKEQKIRSFMKRILKVLANR